MVVQHGDSIDNNVSLRMNRPLLMKLSTNRSVTSRLTNEPVSFQRFRISYEGTNVRVYRFKSSRNFYTKDVSSSFPDPSTQQIRDTLFSIIEKRETARCVFIHFLSLHSRILSRLQRRRRKSAKKNEETLQEDFYSQWIKV